ncbi:putative cadherin-23, partial [Apostichopus japonicus]
MFVTDINDNDPYFENLPTRLEPSLQENTTVGSVVLTITMDDVDADTNGQVDANLVEVTNVFCELDAFSVEEISTNVYQLKLAEELNYDLQSEYTVCLQATDRGVPSLSSDVSRVIIPIEDVQNLSPIFLNQPYDKSIPEDLAVGEFVIRVTAQDGDRGVPLPNAIRYDMDSEKFEINSTTGDVTVKAGLDREDVAQYTLVVNATEIDSTQPESQIKQQTDIFITISDVDDNMPEFDTTSATATVAENAAVNSALNMELNVVDEDSPENADITLSLSQPFDVFKLQTNTFTSSGRVDVRVMDSSYLDYEMRDEIIFQVIATSGSFESTANVTVTITDENDNTPNFTKTEYIGSFKEDVSSGEFILDVQADDADGDTLVYFTSAAEFDVDSSNGRITTAVSDFDAEIRTQYTFTVIASDGRGRSSAVLVNLECTDVNDRAPEFQRSELQLYEDEFDSLTEPENVIGNVLAIDLDASPPNNVITYSIDSGNDQDKFRIDNVTGDIYFAAPVDYEMDQAFTLIILAEDNGTPSLSDSATVTVNIVDINDNDPEFQQTFYSFDIGEDAVNGAIVGQVKATDKDSSYNGEVDYFIRSGSLDDFFITKDGNISVSGNLDRDVVANYSLEIVASDRGTPLREDSCQVTITVTDVNNKPPTFEPDSYVGSVDEDANPGAEILTVSAIDTDDDSNLIFSIESIDPNVTEQFKIGETSGIITVGKELDYETYQTYQLLVNVEDLNTVSGVDQDTATVTINIGDVNDNSPVFENVPYEFSVEEESTSGTVISTDVSAVDMDEGINADIKYRLEDDAEGKLRIDEVTGALVVIDRIDREDIGDLLTIVIIAEDGGLPTRNATIQANIKILDINDNTPEFNENLCADIEVSEGVIEGTATGCTVSATDRDSEWGEITYSIQGGNTLQWFQINNKTGEITVGPVSPDREVADEVILNINAADPGSRTATQDVTITILDVNDEAPEFTVFSNDIVTTESTRADITLTTVIAEDGDKANTNASTVRYEIIAGNKEGLFKLDAETGKLDTKESLQTAAGIYTLSIRAYDLGSPRMQSNPRDMTITVQDINDNTPVFVFPNPDPDNMTIVNIRELTLEPDHKSETELSALVNLRFMLDIIDTPPYFWDPNEEGSEPMVTQLEITENNQGEVGQIDLATERDDSQDVYYFIVDGNEDGLFSINKTTGVIVANEVLSNNDGNNLYELIIKATNDSNFEPESRRRRATTAAYNPALDPSLLTVIITVVDTNDNPPEFTQDLYTAGVLYTVDFDVSVLQVSVTDFDTDEENRRVGFYIESQRRITP